MRQAELAKPPEAVITTSPNLSDPEAGNRTYQMILMYFRRKSNPHLLHWQADSLPLTTWEALLAFIVVG